MSASHPIPKHSVVIDGRKTSVSLEPPFWDTLARVAEGRGISINALMNEIRARDGAANLSSALRLFVLDECMAALSGALAAAALAPQTTPPLIAAALTRARRLLPPAERT